MISSWIDNSLCDYTKKKFWSKTSLFYNPLLQLHYGPLYNIWTPPALSPWQRTGLIFYLNVSMCTVCCQRNLFDNANSCICILSSAKPMSKMLSMWQQYCGFNVIILYGTICEKINLDFLKKKKSISDELKTVIQDTPTNLYLHIPIL